MFLTVISLLVFIVTLLFALNWVKLSYWKAKGVATPPFLPLLGHAKQLFFSYRWDEVDTMYANLKQHRFWGIYEWMNPSLVISDPDLLRDIMVKDFDHFTDRRSFKFNGKESIFNEMLTSIKGDEWKSLRAIMSPTFSSGKIKAMFPLILEKSNELVKQCEKEMAENSYVEMHSLFGYYSMDVIATCAFGIDDHCLERRENSDFIKQAKKMHTINFKLLMKFMVLLVSPKLFNLLGLHFNEETIAFYINVVKETVSVRKKTGMKRGDFLDLLLEALEVSKSEDNKTNYPMSMETVISQSVLFILAGFDTTSSGLSFIAYFLAKHQEEQKKIRKELLKLIEVDGEVTYQNIMEAQYLDAFISESLRLFGPAFFNERVCTKSYKLSDSDVVIPKDMVVSIPNWSLHRDPEYWPDPLTFKPERFLPENRGNIKPFTYLPFGSGPRNCIGMRFAQLEVKLAIASLCLNFEMELRPGYKEPTLEKTMNPLRPDKSGVQLVMKKIPPSK